MDTTRLRKLLSEMHPETLRTQALALLPTELESRRLNFIDFTTGVPWLVRLIPEGGAFGGLKFIASEDVIEFWDRRHDHDPNTNAQFVSCYYASTLRTLTGGLTLDGGVPSWQLDSRSMGLVRLHLLHKD